MKNFMSFLTLLTYVTSAFAQSPATIPNNRVVVGKTGAADKVIEFNLSKAGAATNPKIKYSNTDAKIQFTNDGTNYKNLGSGGGGGSGGVQLLSDNPDFELGIANAWTQSSAGTVVARTGANAMFDLISARFTATAGSQTYTSNAYEVKSGLAGNSCLAYIRYATAEATNKYVLNVLDAANTLIASGTLEPTPTGLSQNAYVPFQCPVAGTSIKLQVASSGAAVFIDIDNAHLGSDTRLADVSQATLYGSIRYNANTNCVWTLPQASLNTTSQNFPVDSDCSVASTTGSASAPSTMVPGIKFASLPPGEYRIVAQGFFGKFNGSNGVNFRWSDGTNLSAANVFWEGTTVGAGIPVTVGRFNYTTAQSNITIQAQCSADAASPTTDCFVASDLISGTNSRPLEISVYRYPTQTEQVVRADLNALQPAGEIMAFSGTTCPTGWAAADGSAVSRTTYSQLFSRVGTAFGAGDGTTTFNLPDARNVFLRGANASTRTIGGVTYPAVSRGTTTTDALQGHQHDNIPRVNTVFAASGGAGQLFSGVRDWVTGNPTSDGSNGTPRTGSETRPVNLGVNYCVRMNDQSMIAPVLVGGVTSNSSGQVRVESASVVCGASSSVTRQTGNWITSIGNISSGICVLNTAGAFSSTPSCTISTDPLGATIHASTYIAAGTSAINISGTYMTNGSTTVQYMSGNNFHIVCVGPK
jgi:microcystin-dependent protein